MWSGETQSFRFDFAVERPTRDEEGARAQTARENARAAARADVVEPLARADDAGWIGARETYGTREIVRCDRNACASTIEGCDAEADVVRGTYEGGLKTWEGAEDLANEIAMGGVDLGGWLGCADVAVCEVGAGHGVPALVAARALGGRCGTLTLTDYNRDVVEEVTAPNAQATFELMESEGERAPREVRYLCGDWSGYDAFVEAGSVDVMLTSESIYDVEQYQSLCSFIDHALHERGACYVAAKRYYFGVGGGTNAFTMFCEKHFNFTVERLKTFSDGKSNVREILVLRKRR